MNPRIVEGVIVVRENLHRFTPWARGRSGFGIPQFAKPGRLAVALHENHDPSFPPGIESHVAAVHFDGFPVSRRNQELDRSIF
jgi:hypothetical protein